MYLLFIFCYVETFLFLTLLIFILCKQNFLIYKIGHEKVRCHVHVQTAITFITEPKLHGLSGWIDRKQVDFVANVEGRPCQETQPPLAIMWNVILLSYNGWLSLQSFYETETLISRCLNFIFASVFRSTVFFMSSVLSFFLKKT